MFQHRRVGHFLSPYLGCNKKFMQEADEDAHYKGHTGLAIAVWNVITQLMILDT